MSIVKQGDPQTGGDRVRSTGRGDPRPGRLPRRRLVEQLSEGVGGPLTLICAPAGYGKTELVASWVEQIEATEPGVTLAHQVLREHDRTPVRFWTAATASLRSAGVRVPAASRSRAAGRATAAPPTGLAGALAAHPEPVVWVLDCAEHTLTAEVGRGIDGLLEQSGENLRLVLLTRSDPPLPLHRFRLAGRCREIRAADLAFSASETTALMHRQGVSLTPPQVVALRSRTGGWPAGLRFASVALAGSNDLEADIERFRGDSENVAAFLMSEVLDRQPEAIARFLLRTCVVDELEPGLVSALTGQPEDADVLEFLTHGNVFVEPVPHRPAAYRYPPLFREFLRSRLVVDDAALQRELHHRAALWLAGREELAAAIDHAVRAGDWLLASRLLVERGWVAGLLVGERLSLLRDWFAALPADVEGADAAIVRAAQGLAVRDLDRCGAELSRARSTQPDEFSPEGRARLLAIAVLDTVCRSQRPDVEAALESALASETALRRASAEAAPVAVELTVLAARSRACVLLERGELGAAGRALEEGIQAVDGPGLEDVVSHLRGLQALVHAVAGRLRRATDLVGRLETSPEGHSSRTASTAHAWVLLERNDLDGAQRLLTAAQDQANGFDAPVLYRIESLLRARLLSALGSHDLARAELSGSAPPAAAAPAVSWLDRCRVTVRVTSLLEQGRATDALAVLPRHERCEHLECHLLRRRILTACGFEPMSPLPPARAVAHCALDVQVERLLAMVEQARRRDDEATAASLLESALRLAAPERLRLPFVEAGAEVTEMLAREEVLRRHRWIRTGPAETEAAEDTDEFVTPHELTEAAGARETVDGSAEPSVAAPVDPLTAKEREVLGHLAALLTTEEIAATMFVSVNTVRSHVRSILRKLGVSRRNEAVRRAWDLHLLQPPPRSGVTGDDERRTG